MNKKYDVIIIGAGPAGIFTALEILKEKPYTNMLILEKGRTVDRRKCPKDKTNKCIGCSPCGITSGVGGAGTTSDGKLSLSADVGGYMTEYIGEEKTLELIKYVDDIYLKFGGNPKIHYDEEFATKISDEAEEHGLKLIKCPVRHLGTEDSAAIMEKMYRKIKSYPNVEFEITAPVKSIIIDDGDVKGIVRTTTKSINIMDHVNGYYGEDIKKNVDEEIFANRVVVAVGRNGAEWLHNECVRLGIKTTNNAVDIGVRIELPREITDRITDKLYEFKFVYHTDTFKDKVRTFCMNPGGFVTQENYDEGLAVVNGHCFSKTKSQNTNFALLVSSSFTEPFNDPIEYGKYIAKLSNMLTGGGIMVQRLEDIKLGRRTTDARLKEISMIPTLKDAVAGDLSFVLPHRHMIDILETIKALDKICPGIDGKNTLLYGVEVKFYSSRIKVNNNLETDINGLYCIGDGAGITRGVIQASISGVVAARDIVKQL